MSKSFAEIILKVITEYKGLLKRLMVSNSTSTRFSEEMKKLGISRSHLRECSDLTLHSIATTIIKDLETQTTKNKKFDGLYFGAEEFLNHLKKIMDDFIVDGDRVLHSAHKASCAVIDVIQYISLPEYKFTADVVENIHKSIAIVSKYGTAEQAKILLQAIKTNEELIANFFKKYGRTLNFDELVSASER